MCKEMSGSWIKDILTIKGTLHMYLYIYNMNVNLHIPLIIYLKPMRSFFIILGNLCINVFSPCVAKVPEYDNNKKSCTVIVNGLS